MPKDPITQSRVYEYENDVFNRFVLKTHCTYLTYHRGVKEVKKVLVELIITAENDQIAGFRLSTGTKHIPESHNKSHVKEYHYRNIPNKWKDIAHSMVLKANTLRAHKICY